MRFLDDEPDIPPQINIVPMIDVIFSILAFFIVSSLFLTRSEGLDVNLPQASTSQLQRTEQITVTINKKGQIFLKRISSGHYRIGSITPIIPAFQYSLIPIVSKANYVVSSSV